jgi:hypothetical protein
MAKMHKGILGFFAVIAAGIGLLINLLIYGVKYKVSWHDGYLIYSMVNKY